MKNMTLKPMLASGEYVALPCAAVMPAIDRRSIVARGAAWATALPNLGAVVVDGKRVRTTGKHTGFAHRAGSLTWSPPI